MSAVPPSIPPSATRRFFARAVNVSPRNEFKRATSLTALSLLCALLCLKAGCKRSLSTHSALHGLQGYWEGGGAGGIKCSIAITNTSLDFYSRTDFWYKATFTLPAGTDPKSVRE